MPYIIDAHLDLAYNALSFQRNYLLPAVETRRMEKDTLTPQRNGHTLLGWADMQRGQVALVYGTLFLTPRRYAKKWETMAYNDPAQARVLYEKQVSYYRRLTDEHSDQFRLVLNQVDLRNVMEVWEKEPAYLPAYAPDNGENEAETRPTGTHPVGIVMLLEGAEGLRAPEEIEYWWEMGVRVAGPVWAGIQFCGGTYEPGEFTRDGLELLEIMGGIGMTLDISHMNEVSALQALDRYEGPVVATHANARALLKGIEGERHLTDRTIQRLIERDGVMGIIPFNRMLDEDWRPSDARLPLTRLVEVIDHICQVTGDARFVGLGTDFDGGFGREAVPEGLESNADLGKLGTLLAERGYADVDVTAILSGNWLRLMRRVLSNF